MTATILIVDDLEQNIKLLEAKLVGEYYTILTANSGLKALQILEEQKVDVVLLDVMMPGIDGFETCRKIKANPETRHIPVVMVTALTDIEDRVKGLESGADEFLTKPIRDPALIARVKSLVRTKGIIDELKLRNKVSKLFGENLDDIHDNFINNKIALLDDDVVQAKNIKQALKPVTEQVTIVQDLQEILDYKNEPFDLLMISCHIEGDPLRIGVTLRANPQFRHSVLMLLAQEEDMPLVIKSLDLGINDYCIYPVDKSELQARVRTQLRRKIYQDYLRRELEEKVNLSTKDGLTGVFNRRYFDVHVKQMVERVKSSTNQKIALILLDMDHFKRVNDNYGHQSGDEVLKHLSDILKESVRITDLIARYGGEEFAILLTNADLKIAENIAEALRKTIEEFEFVVSAQKTPLKETASIGIAEFNPNETIENFIRRTDKALYQAKNNGRNCVVKAEEK